jgi:spore coat polysaccharide biosynthesis predicted glycosyltransferase SpsG
MSAVLLRAASGPAIGRGHVMRTRAVAQELLGLGAQPLLVVDDDATAQDLSRAGFPCTTAARAPDWHARPARAAWLDGRRDWRHELRALREAGTPAILVENRVGRELAECVLHPALHHQDDDWDRAHASRVLSGAAWIPLAREIRSTSGAERDVDLLVSFGGSDPERSTERVLEALAGDARRVQVAIGPHMAARRAAIEAHARALPSCTLLATGAPLGAAMARSRLAITALGTTLYELAYLGTPAWILANYAADRAALAWYGAHGPHRPLGLARAVGRADLVRALALEPWHVAPDERIGSGSAALAELLLGAARRSA